MGLFSYECPICGGGEQRCGTNHESDGYVSDYVCDGGQCCWENNVIYKELGSNCYEEATYSGYGYVENGRNEIYTIDFEMYFDGWQISKQNDIISGSFYCKSCFMNDIFPKLTNKTIRFKNKLKVILEKELKNNDEKIADIIFSFLPDMDPMFDNPYNNVKKYNYKLRFCCDYCDDIQYIITKNKKYASCMCDSCEMDMIFEDYVDEIPPNAVYHSE